MTQSSSLPTLALSLRHGDRSQDLRNSQSWNWRSCGPKIRYLRDPSQRADLKSEAVGQGVSEEYRLRVLPFAGSFALDRHSISFDHIRCFFCDHNGWCIRISGD